MADWDQRFLELATLVGSWSKDRSTKVGAVIVGNDREVLSMGYNGFPRNCDDDIDERHQRPLKYKWSEHAERNAIYNAVRNGVNLQGSTMYLCWFPCTDCARAIVQSGIKKLVCTKPDLDNPRWGDDFKVSLEILTECNVEVQTVEVK